MNESAQGRGIRCGFLDRPMTFCKDLPEVAREQQDCRGAGFPPLDEGPEGELRGHCIKDMASSRAEHCGTQLSCSPLGRAGKEIENRGTSELRALYAKNDEVAEKDNTESGDLFHTV